MATIQRKKSAPAIRLRAVYKADANTPARVDGVPTWNADVPALVSLAPATDGLSCEAAGSGQLGAVTVTADADADLGSGVRALSESITIEYIPDVQEPEATNDASEIVAEELDGTPIP